MFNVIIVLVCLASSDDSARISILQVVAHIKQNFLFAVSISFDIFVL